ncbi:MAG TPA: acyl-CoA dehydrogenase family protein [Minicystis sp.]|nr:acyl-CoA dehydrogenase family protein [Minicystis sp.]
MNATHWVTKARALGPELAEGAGKRDVDGSFVRAGYALLRKHRFFSMGIPTELGGGGATHAELCDTTREIARFCPSTALAFSMHSHLVAATVWKHLRGEPGEQLLRRIAAQQTVLLSTGASDWIDSNGTMENVDGGYRVTARKGFGSGGPAADLIVTSARYEDAKAGPQVLHFAVPTTADGVRFADDWDTLGMRATGSNTVLFERVFVPEAAVSLRRPRGQWHPVWSVVLTVAAPIYMSPYVGLAEAAREAALASAVGKSDAPHVAYLAGELENALAETRLAWKGMIDNAKDYDFSPELERANAALIGKTLCARAAKATVEKAMALAGGAGFFRASPLERMMRDVCAAAYHALPEMRQIHFSGMVALGRDPISGKAVSG